MSHRYLEGLAARVYVLACDAVLHSFLKPIRKDIWFLIFTFDDVRWRLTAERLNHNLHVSGRIFAWPRSACLHPRHGGHT